MGEREVPPDTERPFGGEWNEPEASTVDELVRCEDVCAERCVGAWCPYCGGPNPFWDDLDPRSWECTTCLTAASANDPETLS